MPVVKVLLDSKGKVMGTAQDVPQPSGSAPRATLIAGTGQQIVEVNLTAAEARLDAEQLHAALARKKFAVVEKPVRAARKR
jgi:hypothetical protein